MRLWRFPLWCPGRDLKAASPIEAKRCSGSLVGLCLDQFDRDVQSTVHVCWNAESFALANDIPVKVVNLTHPAPNQILGRHSVQYLRFCAKAQSVGASLIVPVNLDCPAENYGTSAAPRFEQTLDLRRRTLRSTQSHKADLKCLRRSAATSWSSLSLPAGDVGTNDICYRIFCFVFHLLEREARFDCCYPSYLNQLLYDEVLKGRNVVYNNA